MAVILNYLLFRAQTRYGLPKAKDFFIGEGKL
jgi:hypothetical protein